jgi:hypothetical protein
MKIKGIELQSCNAGRARKSEELRLGREGSPSLASVAQLTICFIFDPNQAPVLRRCVIRLVKTYRCCYRGVKNRLKSVIYRS